MKILALVNWKIAYLRKDRPDIQPPDKSVEGEKYWFFKYWPERSLEVDVLDFNRVPLVHTLEKKVLKFYLLQAFRAFFVMKRYDLVISHGAQSALVLDLMRRLSCIKMPPHLVIDVGCFNGGRNREYEIAPIRYAARSISGVVYHSRVQEEYYRRHVPFLKTRFVPFSVDTEFFSPENTEKGNYILSAGYAKRDYGTLLKAWAGLPRGETVLKIAGIKKGGLSNVPPGVELIGRVPVDEFKKMIAGAKFVILPLPFYKYSYGQMTLLQSMAMAKAVIVTKTPSTEGYVSDGNDGMFARPYDAADMRAKVARLLDNPESAEEMGRKARLSVTGKFNEKDMGKMIYDFAREFVRI